MPFILLFTSIAFAITGQLLMKAGILRVEGIDFSRGNIPGQMLRLVTCPQIIFGLVVFAVSMIFYLAAISKLDISMAYPMVSINYVLIQIFSKIFFHEKINLYRVFGVLFIISGVVLISRS
ncbi:MAG: SMR family transporter [bacterium]